MRFLKVQFSLLSTSNLNISTSNCCYFDRPKHFRLSIYTIGLIYSFWNNVCVFDFIFYDVDIMSATKRHKETFNEFSTRVIRTMYNFPSEVIKNIKDTMDGRMDAIVTGKGKHTKF